MDEKSILQKIIEQEGCCDWAESQPQVCETCPLSKLKANSKGGFYSCVEAVGADSLDAASANKRYKVIATGLLTRVELEEAISDESEN